MAQAWHSIPVFSAKCQVCIDTWNKPIDLAVQYLTMVEYVMIGRYLAINGSICHSKLNTLLRDPML